MVFFGSPLTAVVTWVLVARGPGGMAGIGLRFGTDPARYLPRFPSRRRRCRIPVLDEDMVRRSANALNDMEKQFQGSRLTCTSQSLPLKTSAES